jgi:hypothetical protein
MNSEPVDYDGTPMSEYIASIPDELPRDAVGLWQIVPAGRSGFLLTGTDLVDFVRRAIYALLDAGALPVRGSPGSGFDWIVQKQYGTGTSQITEAIINEWAAMPDDPLILCGQGVWFARPRAGSKHVKLD